MTEVMPVETALSIAMLGGFIWAVRFLVPRAIKSGDAMAIACAVLTALLALCAWLLIGIRMRSVDLI